MLATVLVLAILIGAAVYLAARAEPAPTADTTSRRAVVIAIDQAGHLIVSDLIDNVVHRATRGADLGTVALGDVVHVIEPYIGEHIATTAAERVA